MTKKTALAAQARAKAGKGAARAVRRTGAIPGVIYGDNKEPVLISLTEKDMKMALGKRGFFQQLCDLDVEGKKNLVLPRDVQLDPVSDRPIHADFLRVTEKTIIRVEVPVTVSNQKESPGLVKGGVLNLVRHEIEVYCPATEIPEEFNVDLKGLDVGSSVHIEDLNLPKNVTPALQGNFTVVTIVAPSALKSEVEEAATAATPAEGATAAPAEGAAAAAAPAAGAAAPATKDAGKAKK